MGESHIGMKSIHLRARATIVKRVTLVYLLGQGCWEKALVACPLTKTPSTSETALMASFLVLKICFCFMCVRVLWLHVCLCTCVQFLQRSKEVVKAPRPGVIDSWEPPCGQRELNLNLLREQPMLLTTGLNHLSSPIAILFMVSTLVHADDVYSLSCPNHLQYQHMKIRSSKFISKRGRGNTTLTIFSSGVLPAINGPVATAQTWNCTFLNDHSCCPNQLLDFLRPFHNKSPHFN